VAKPEWGRKLTCVSCGVKFYDLHRNPAECPSCGTQNDPLQTWKPKRSKAAALPKAAPKEAPVEEEAAEEPDMPEEDDAVLESDDDEDEDLMEDTSDLGGDEDDVSEVAEHIEVEGDDKD